MENKRFEYTILYTLVACIAISFAAIVRLFSVSLGLDEFSANVLFVVTIAIIGAIYLSIHVFLQSVAIPLISNLLLKIPYFNNKRKIVENDTTTQLETENTPIDLDTVRAKHLEKEQKRNAQLLEDALQYTQETFAPYTSDENINTICQAVTDYFNRIEIRVDKSVSVNELSNGDIFHFGWNIWNRFQPIRKSKLENIATLLKTVFEKQLKDVEIDTIRKKLTFNEGKYKIKLEK